MLWIMMENFLHLEVSFRMDIHSKRHINSQVNRHKQIWY